MRENVINLEVVMADGTIINTAGKDRRTKYGQIFTLTCSVSRIESRLYQWEYCAFFGCGTSFMLN